MKRYKTFKKINRQATLFGLPYLIFFITILFLIIFGFIFLSVKQLTIKIILGSIIIIFLVMINFLYKKLGMKYFLKTYDLFFRDINHLKDNEPLKIQRNGKDK